MEKLIEIKVMSKSYASRFRSDKPWAVISVSTHRSEFARLSEDNRVGLLQLSFHDIANERISQTDAYRGLLFTKEQAKEVLDFVKEVLPQIEILLVHCEAGMSRSPAIAAAIAHVLWGPEADKVYFDKYIPNSFVYKTLLEVHYDNDEEKVEAFSRKAEERIYDENGWDCTE